ncbi:MAG: 3-isopropylmalate dehydrogenase [Desulfuromonadales bacterium]|nr:3-isopropylmalate dehydrogenase [Desulfuromonadales bacterium]
MKTYDIGVVPGDGTGPEVTAEAMKALKALSEAGGPQFNLTYYDVGGDRYISKGELLPDSVISELRQMNAIFLGAIGHPDVKPGILEKEILLKLRFELDLYINLRPVILFPGVYTPLKDKGPEDIDFVIVRENTEGLYTGSGGFLRKGSLDEVAIQESINTRRGVERCVRYAFEYCRKRNKEKKLTLCGKTNVLTYAFDLWERVFEECGSDYPDIELDYAHVDACCMWMVKNPDYYDVIVTTNMFGDIITDLGGILQGGMGVAAGGNLNPDSGGVSMFEPMGGSAPKYAGQNVINPIAAINAMAMLLEHSGFPIAGRKIDAAVAAVTGTKMKSQAAGKMGYSTEEVGDLVVESLS